MRANDNDLPVMNTTSLAEASEASNLRRGMLLYDGDPTEMLEYSMLAHNGIATLHVLKTLSCDHIYRTGLGDYTILDDALAFCGKSTYALMRFTCVDGGGVYKGPYMVREDGFGVGSETFFERRGSYYYRSNGNPRRFIAQVWGVCDQLPSDYFLDHWYENVVNEHSDDEIPF